VQFVQAENNECTSPRSLSNRKVKTSNVPLK